MTFYPWTRAGLIATSLATGLALWSASWAQSPPNTVDVQRGDTFSQIAARYTGDARTWRKLYHPQKSGLANPDLILVGAKLELVTEPGGARYLRMTSPGGPVAAAPVSAPAPAAAPARAAAPAAPAVAAAPAAPPTAAPVAAAAVAPPVAPVVAAPPLDTLTIGVLPNIPAATLMGQYESLKRYLERNNSFKVRIVVPANFKAFFDATMAGEYDVAVGAPNLQRVAQLDRNMVVLGMYEPRINAVFVAPIESTVTGGRDVSGKSVAFANPQSLVALYGQQWLRGINLEPGKDYEIKAARTDLGVGRMLLTGEAVAAIMSNGEFRAIPPDELARLKIVEVFARIPNFIWLAHPRLERERTAKLRTQLREFFADKDDGATFGRATGLTGMADVDDTILRELDAFAAPTRRAMGVAR
jgi:phosphonate transport system substrate-binding protein